MRDGEMLGDYQILHKLHQGRVTAIYAAKHVALGSEHAIRVLLPQWAEDPERRAKFLALGQVQGRFKHPNLVRVTDAIDQPDAPALVTDRIPSQSLRDQLNHEGWIAPKEAVQITRQLLDALTAALAAGIPHGRLSPESLLLDAGTLRLVGFGQDLPGVDPPVSTLGTTQRAYLAPEIVQGATPDGRSDVFSAGAILWEMLAGRGAFEGTTAFAAMQATLAKDPGSPDRHGELPGWLEAILEAALQKEPDDRIHSAAAFEAALAAGPRGAELPVVVAPPAPTKAGTGAARFFGVLAAILVGALLLGGLGIGGIALLVHFNRPPKVHTLQVTSDACGDTLVAIDAYAKGSVEVWVDGTLVHTEVGDGQLHIEHPIQLEPGAKVHIEARTGSSRSDTVHNTTGTPVSIRFEQMGESRVGQLGKTRVHVEGSCVPEGLRYVAEVEGQRIEGPVTPTFDLDTVGLKEGRHVVSVDLLDGDRVVRSASTKILVGEAPPPDDLDLDGYKSKEDCNDLDPAVHPGRDEEPVPNGVDDNCDGRTDEGTVAFDDDGDGITELDGDCDDADPLIRPGIKERPDCRDQDCDGTIDEGVTLPERDDGYEPNDTQTLAHDLKTNTKRWFTQDLALVASSTADDAWFKFYSQDGDWDDWGIDVSIPQLPANSSVLLEVYDSGGAARGSLMVTEPTQELQIRGRAFHDDSGNYKLLVSPKSLHADWCPLTVHIEAR